MLSNRFRWVYCQLEALRQCLPNNLLRILVELPKSLDETYQRILKEINNANQKEAHRLLQCLAVAHRPLRVEELAEVLALDVDARGVPRFNAKWRWEDHEAAVLSACSSLVSVINHDASRVVQFSHFSVKEFLTSDRLVSMADVSQFHIADEPSHAILAQACLGVLLSVDSDGSVKDIPLLPYADEYWTEHAQVGNVELRIKDALNCLFDVHKPHFEAHVSRAGQGSKLRYFRTDEDPKGVLTPAAPFTFAFEYGLNGVAEWLIVANQPQVIGCRFHGWTLLHLAVHDKHIEAARLLLAHGADINSRKDYRTPPHITSLQSQSERSVGGSLEEVDEIENSLQNSDADLSSEETIDEDMGYGKESGFTPLHLAVSKGYLDMCQMLLEHKADVHAHDNSGNTSLHLAASKDHLEIARILLKYNAEVNSRNEDGSTPLLIASSSGNIDIFRLLLAHDADAFVHDIRGNTPLHVAAIGGHLEVTRSLLERKASVNALDDEGSTPLHQASQNSRSGDPDIAQLVRLLLDNGADIHARDNSGNHPLHFAASRGHLEVARVLLELKADVDPLNCEGLTPLQRASGGQHEGYLDIMRLLLNHGANVIVHDQRRNTPLHFAASQGDLEIARMLLEHKANVNALDDEGSTPLHKASQCPWSGDPDIVQLVRLLLDDGADVHTPDNGGNTPLHFAALRGHPEVARMLVLEHKADVNVLNKEGSTPLHQIFEGWGGNNADIVRLLLDHGAGANVYDKSGNTLLHFAASKGDLELARMVLERDANVNSQNDGGCTAFLLALKRQHPDVAWLLLDHNADVHVHNNGGDTPLHVAVRNGNLDACRILLDRNADVDSLDDHGCTPLHNASTYGTLDAVQLLLSHGADSHVRDSDGDTPLHCAAFGGQLEVARLLLKLDVKVNSRNNEGSTPLHLASVGRGIGHPDIVRLLVDHGADVQARNLSGETASEVARGPYQQEIVQLLSKNAAE
jgi:ankyrin repeat protein